MSETLYFLPWLRRGLGLGLTNRDDSVSALPRNALIRAHVEVDGEPAEAELALRPADHAVGIDAAQIIRRYPAPGEDAESGYFPLLELSAPDLPWLLTPAAPDDGTGRLRPWLALVCVEEAASQFLAGENGRPARLVAPTDQLPDLAESFAWVHIQSAVKAAEVPDSLASQPGAVIARLVCPRRLEPDTRYRASLVNAFAVDGESLAPAWTAGGGPAELTVYDTWTFATGQASSFEELCRRLGPVQDPTLVFGLRTTDITELGPVDPWPADSGTVTVEYAGALWDADVHPLGLGKLAADFAEGVSQLLDQSHAHVTMPRKDADPVVTPPFYGSYAAYAGVVPEDGWLRSLNVVPRLRASAGLGADVVRKHQERFMAMAWRQAGQLRETNRQLSLTRLQAEVGRTWKHRADALDPHLRVTVLRPQLSFIRDSIGQAPRHSLRSSTIPDGLVSPAYLRVVRPGGVVDAAAARRHPEGHVWHATLGDSFGSPEIRALLDFAAVRAPDGTRFADPRRPVPAEPDDGFPDDTIPGGEFPGIDPGAIGIQPGIITSAYNLSFDAVAALATAEIQPLKSARDRIQARIPALTGAHAHADDDELPTRVAVGPIIDEALMWSLVERSPELLLPGVQSFPNNAVRVVEANTEFVASFLAGANHEMARELLWREYPADLAATTFRRFWDRPDLSAADIEPMTDWARDLELDLLGAAGGESVVVLIRGDLVRHYPTVRILLQDPRTRIASRPSFSGWIPPDVRFVGFDVADADAVTDPAGGWNVVLEEQPTEPRFGLDTLPPGEKPPELRSWNDLCWEHLIGQGAGAHLLLGDDGFPSEQAPPPGATWGLNSAHMARVTYQAPFRMTFPVAQLIGSGGGVPRRASDRPSSQAPRTPSISMPERRRNGESS